MEMKTKSFEFYKINDVVSPIFTDRKTFQFKRVKLELRLNEMLEVKSITN